MATRVIDHNELKRVREDALRDEVDYGFDDDDNNFGNNNTYGNDDDDVEIVNPTPSIKTERFATSINNNDDDDVTICNNHSSSSTKKRLVEVIFADKTRYIKSETTASTREPPHRFERSAAPRSAHASYQPIAASHPPARRQESEVMLDERRQNQINIQRMLNSPRRNCIRFAPDRQCFVFKDRRVLDVDPNPTAGEIALIGIREILRWVCFPNYRYHESLETGTNQFAAQRISTGLRFANHGAARGRDVHDQMSMYIEKGREAWRRHYGYGCSDYVERIYSFLMSRGLKPIVSEFQDYFNGLKIGSSIDIICEDTEYAGIAIIELKVGGENYFEKANAPLVSPPQLRNLNNSPRNQALLQLLVYRAMITENYPYVRVTRCYVLQARTDNIVLFGLTQTFIDAQASLISVLAARRSYDISRQQAGGAWRGRPSNRGRSQPVRGRQWPQAR